MKAFKCALIAGALYAQSITILTPTASESISGTAYTLSATLTSLPTVASVEYLIDHQRLVIVEASPWSYQWSSFELWNGAHKIRAVARDAAGATLATSADVAFTIANGSDTIAVTPSTAATSPWSGIITFSITITRGDGQDSNCYLYLDGIRQSQTTGSTSCSMSLDTKGFENGARHVFIQGSHISTNVARGMWAHEVTFANTATVQTGVRAGFSELWMIPTGTEQLTPTIVLADSSVIAATTSLPVSDAFTRANETPLVGDWSQSEGSIKLVSNAITGNSSEANAAYFWNGATFPEDQYSEITATAFGTNNFIGVVGRALPGGTYYGCSWDGTTMYLFRRIAGVTSGGYPNAASAGSVNDVLRIEVSGQSPVHIVCEKNDVEVLSHDDSASDRISYGQAGVYSFRDTGTTIGDNFAAGALSGGSPTAIYRSANASVATVSSAGLVTAVATGDTDITVFSRGLTATVRATVNAANTLPHFGRDGTVLTSYAGGNSFLRRSWFFAGRTQLSVYAGATTDYIDGGANTWEEGIYLSPSSGETEVDWETRLDAHIAALATFASSSGLLLLGTGDDMARLNLDLYKATRGIWRTWSPDPIVRTFTALRDGGFVNSVEMVDETSLAHGNNPYPQGTVNAGGPFTQISATGGVCTASYTNAPANGSSAFIISGVTTDTDLNSVSPALFTITSFPDANSFLFNCPSVSNGVYNAATDPAMTIHSLASEWVSGDYVRNDAIDVLVDFADTVSNRPKITWPVAASASAVARTNWNAHPPSDYLDVYWAASLRATPTGQTVPDLIYDMRTAYRNFYSVIPRTNPWTMITAAAGPMYKIGGIAKAISSIALDGTVTFSEDHGIASLIHGTTRVDISGNSALNGDFYIITTPTTTTARLAYKTLAHPGTGFGGTALFDTSQSFTVISLQVDGIVNTLQVADPGACQLTAQTHHTFVLSGSSNSDLNRTWYVATANPGASECTYTGTVREVPAIAGTGGTGYVITTNEYLAGRNTLMVPGVSPKAVLASFFYPILQGAAGVRSYGLSNLDPDADPAASNSFQDEPAAGDGINYNASPEFTANGMQTRWNVVAAASHLTRSLEPYLLQPRLAAPDYGSQFLSTVRASANSRLVAFQNITEGTLSRTFDLTSYSVGGAIVKHRITQDGVTSSTLGGLTDSITVQPGEVVIYLSAPQSLRTSGLVRTSGGVTVR